MKLSYVSIGLGNNFGDEIELNKNLLKPEYKHIHDSILEHELSHTNQVFSMEDLKLDLSQSKISSWEVLKFMFKYPKSFTQLLPCYYSSKHGFVYDINLLLIYFVTICLIGIISFVGLIL